MLFERRFLRPMFSLFLVDGKRRERKRREEKRREEKRELFYLALVGWEEKTNKEKGKICYFFYRSLIWAIYFSFPLISSISPQSWREKSLNKTTSLHLLSIPLFFPLSQNPKILGGNFSFLFLPLLLTKHSVRRETFPLTAFLAFSLPINKLNKGTEGTI